ncbi:hypothetical protein [Chitinivibrio alkaliphilus]|uniref:Chemotaxis phosphatase CheX-like domain-containing protein n=1 Tax=Chitinivibrio alkaliphilus ACht1 TaxID=1313304 RepID=U7D5C1_9BACT|nr:hypothetical protein [Chitinivibrio alkaliphilus]ERP31719.1 hypothetical protein CALK_1381 [Chitinivibrio alkaliphilus ACht1]
MKQSDIRAILERTAGVILEESAYLFTALLDEGATPDVATWDAQGAAVSYEDEDKTVHGEVHLWYPPGISTIAAANMLGIDEGDERAVSKGDDALREILNIVAGNVLSSIYGEDILFNLTVPYRLDRDVLMDDEASEMRAWLESEDYPLLCVFHEIQSK